jgi:2-polyprenyl-3-methyl-5-hydroxy-6-metoxy-1,4-benzoquinol methylase
MLRTYLGMLADRERDRHDRREMPALVPFEPIVSSLRAEVIDHFGQRGEPIDTPAGRTTLDTNSILASARADMLVSPFLARSGYSTLEGLRIADLGCGFGSITLALAARGATVVGVDPNVDRMSVGARIAVQFGLDASFQPGTLEAPGLDAGTFDLVVINNAFCYVVDRAARRTALASAYAALRPGGWIVLRDPNRSHPRDVFTRLPLVQRLPPALADRVVGLMGVHRSQVRVTTPRAALRQLRRAGFEQVRFDGSGARRRWLDRIAGHHHTSGRTAIGTGRMIDPDAPTDG